MAAPADSTVPLKGAGLPPVLYRAKEVRELDARIIASGISGFELMQQAGRSAFRQALKHWPEAQEWLIVCGGGNNGGDGYLIAGHALAKGKRVRCLALSDPQKLQGDARLAHEWAVRGGVEVHAADSGALDDALAAADLIIDAMLGTGLTGSVRAPYEDTITAVNGAGKPVLAVDVPSGLSSDTGAVLGAAVKADVTVTFIALKVGLFTGQGPNCTGELVFDDLGSLQTLHDRGLHSEVPAAVIRLDWQRAKRGWPERRPAAHKGNFGRLLVVGGDLGMGGAALLAAEAAARTGSGMVFVATRPEHVPAFLSRRPELIVRGIDHRNGLLPMLEQMDAVVLGPGLGQGAWGQQMFQAVKNLFDGPVLLDADGLNLLAASPSELPGNWVLTPHPGEAARLLGKGAGDVEQDRIKAIAELSDRYKCTVLLKGAGTLVQGDYVRRAGKLSPAAPVPTLIHAGNPGMASGGMGDVLSGIIGALLGYGLDSFHAATLGATLHAAAADVAATELSMAGLLAGDLPLAAARLLASTEAGTLAAEAVRHE